MYQYTTSKKPSVHLDSPFPQRFKARALIQDEQIFLGRGQERSLSHELAHYYLGHTRGRFPTARENGFPILSDTRLERDASRGASQFLSPFIQNRPYVPAAGQGFLRPDRPILFDRAEEQMRARFQNLAHVKSLGRENFTEAQRLKVICDHMEAESRLLGGNCPYRCACIQSLRDYIIGSRSVWQAMCTTSQSVQKYIMENYWELFTIRNTRTRAPYRLSRKSRPRRRYESISDIGEQQYFLDLEHKTMAHIKNSLQSQTAQQKIQEIAQQKIGEMSLPAPTAPSQDPAHLIPSLIENLLLLADRGDAAWTFAMRGVHLRHIIPYSDIKGLISVAFSNDMTEKEADGDPGQIAAYTKYKQVALNAIDRFVDLLIPEGSADMEGVYIRQMWQRLRVRAGRRLFRETGAEIRAFIQILANYHRNLFIGAGPANIALLNRPDLDVQAAAVHGESYISNLLAWWIEVMNEMNLHPQKSVYPVFGADLPLAIYEHDLSRFTYITATAAAEIQPLYNT